MSRCFLFPPPGYPRSKEIYEALVKLGEEKEKKIRKKKEKEMREKMMAMMKERASKQSQGSNGRAVTSTSSTNKNRKRNLHSSIELEYCNLLQKLQLHDDDDAKKIDDSDWLHQHLATLAITPGNKRRRFASDSGIKRREILPKW